MTMRVLVTGATGFVGRVLSEALVRRGHLVRAAVRSDQAIVHDGIEKVVVGNIASVSDWMPPLEGVDAVMHLAARTHVLHDRPDNSHLYMETNAHATRRLAETAARVGVRHFVLLSSVKVNGEETNGRAYDSTDVPEPTDAYGVSKWHAEKAVLDASAAAQMAGSIVRSPLVYGPGVRANFLRLMSWVDKGWPLPLGAVRNARSMVSVWNLCDLLTNALDNPASAGRVWMVSDGEDLSTPELIRRVGRLMRRRVRLVPVPVWSMYAMGRLTGLSGEIKRVCSSLVVNIERTRHELKWIPPLPVDLGLERTVAWYLSEGRLREV